jgi:hypothetical protein
MKPSVTRRELLKATPLAAASLLSAGARQAPASGEADQPPQAVKVLVWDEQQPAQKQAYSNFLGNEIAGHLKSQSGISVRSVCINDPGQGLTSGELDGCNVLIWWGHVRHAEITPETGRAIVKRIKDGKLSQPMPLLILANAVRWLGSEL